MRDEFIKEWNKTKVSKFKQCIGFCMNRMKKTREHCVSEANAKVQILKYEQK